jgi:hypothetical protein
MHSTTGKKNFSNLPNTSSNTLTTENRRNPKDEECNNITLDRWLNEPLKDGPFSAYWNAEFTTRRPDCSAGNPDPPPKNNSDSLGCVTLGWLTLGWLLCCVFCWAVLAVVALRWGPACSLLGALRCT